MNVDSIIIHPYSIRMFFISSNSFDGIQKEWSEFIKSNKEEEIQKGCLKLPKEWEECFEGCKMMVSDYTEDYMDLFVLVNSSVKNISIGSCAHEAYHLVNRIFLRIGHSHDLVNDEMTAYLIGFLTNEINYFLNGIKSS